MFVQDYVLNGQSYGPVADALAGCRFDPGLLRPYYDERGRKCVTVNTGRQEFDKQAKVYKPVYENRLIADMERMGVSSPVFNATSLRKDEWIRLDSVVIKAARQRLRAWADLSAASSFGGFNGMSKMILESETMADPGEAIVDMDGLSSGRTDAPLFKLGGLPLPITHSDFYFSSRRLAVSRNTGTPLDTAMGEAAGRRVAEMVEKTLIGMVTGMTYGTAADYSMPVASASPTVYGYLNYPDRVTKTDMTAPDGTNGTTVLSNWLSLRESMYSDYFYGPFMAYVSSNYDAFLDNEFKTNSDKSLRERLLAIEGINGIRRLDFLTTSNVVIFVQMTPDVARAVNGMDITTVQWETRGGMQLNFKVMCIYVPQLRSDYNGRCGIGVGTTS